jgi:hypothetical protein
LGLDLMLVVAGAGTGLLVGLTGVGGGAVMTPLLLLGFGLTPLSAIGTDLWFAAFTKLVATRVHHGYGLIDWQVVRRLWWGSLPASAMTVAYINVRPIDGAAGGLLKGLIGCAVVLTALAMLFQQQLHELGRKLRIDSVERFKSMQPATTVAAGAIRAAGHIDIDRSRRLGRRFPRLLVPAAADGATADCRRHRPCDSADHVCGYGALADRHCQLRRAWPFADRIDPGRDRGLAAVGSLVAQACAQGDIRRPVAHRVEAAAGGRVIGMSVPETRQVVRIIATDGVWVTEARAT